MLSAASESPKRSEVTPLMPLIAPVKSVEIAFGASRARARVRGRGARLVDAEALGPALQPVGGCARVLRDLGALGLDAAEHHEQARRRPARPARAARSPRRRRAERGAARARRRSASTPSRRSWPPRGGRRSWPSLRAARRSRRPGARTRRGARTCARGRGASAAPRTTSRAGAASSSGEADFGSRRHPRSPDLPRPRSALTSRNLSPRPTAQLIPSRRGASRRASTSTIVPGHDQAAAEVEPEQERRHDADDAVELCGALDFGPRK